MNKDQIVEKIFQTLQRQKFAEWYSIGDFDQWICGNDNKKTDDEIRADIAKLFNLN